MLESSRDDDDDNDDDDDDDDYDNNNNKEAKIQLSRHRNRARHIHPTGIYNDGRDGSRVPEIPLKISRAIIFKKARELRHNNFMGQGESVLCNFADLALMPKGIENPEKEELRC